MKIIQVDNFGRDYQPEVDVATGIKDKQTADVMCQALIAHLSGKAADYFYRVVEDDYVNSRGLADLAEDEGLPIEAPKEVRPAISRALELLSDPFKDQVRLRRREDIALRVLPAIIGLADENRDVFDNVTYAFRIADAFLADCK